MSGARSRRPASLRNPSRSQRIPGVRCLVCICLSMSTVGTASSSSDLLVWLCRITECRLKLAHDTRHVIARKRQKCLDAIRPDAAWRGLVAKSLWCSRMKPCDAARSIAERGRGAVAAEASYVETGRIVSVTVSFGVSESAATATRSTPSYESLMSDFTRAKHNDRDRVVAGKKRLTNHRGVCR